jgi:hypothetical protein
MIKWVVDADPEDLISIRQLDFTDPNSLYPATEDKSSKEQWYINAQRFVEIERPRNTVFVVGVYRKEGGASSTKFNYTDLRQNAITTGSGPS